MNKKPLLFVVIFFALTYFASADLTMNETFENNSLDGWSGGSIESTNPIRGSYSYKHPADGVFYNKSIGMRTNNTFNVSFKFRQDITASGCNRFGITNEWYMPDALPHIENNYIGFAMSNANECASGGDATTLWAQDASGSVNSGQTCAEATTGAGCNMTIEINATDSGNTADTVWRFYLNNNVTASVWYTTKGVMPVRKANAFAIRASTSNSLWFDDLTAYNASSVAPPNPSPNVNFTAPTISNNTNTTFPFMWANVTASDETLLSLINITLFRGITLVNSTSSSTSPLYINFSNLDIDGNYSLNATAKDDTGNQNVTETRIIRLDRQAPNLGFAFPTPANGTYIGFSIFVNASFNDSTTGINEVNISLFNSTQHLINSTLGRDTNSFATNFSNLVDGTYYFNVTVNDFVLNTNRTITYNVTLDNIAPNVDFVAPSSINDTNTTITGIWANITASDARNVSLINITLFRGIILVNSTSSYTSPIYANFSVDNQPDGNYSLNATATDILRQNVTSTRIIRIDRQAPNLGFASPTLNNGTYNRKSLVINASFNDSTTGINEINISLYNGSFHIINSTLGRDTNSLYINFSNLVDGIYYYNVTATDFALNKNITTTYNVTLAAPSIKLYLDGLDSDRKYEYYTLANITANFTSCTDCVVCVDIDDSINNISSSLGSKNYVCGANSVSFLYNISILRVNKLNDSTLFRIITNSSRYAYIDLDNRTIISSFSFNLTGIVNTSYPKNVHIDLNADNVSEVVLLGELRGEQLYVNEFTSDGIVGTIFNITRNTAGTKTIFMNISTNGFNRTTHPVINLTFRLDGFDIDKNIEFHTTRNFTNYNNKEGTFGSNISTVSAIYDFEDNLTTGWSGNNLTVLSQGDDNYLQMSSKDSSGEYSCGRGVTIYTENSTIFDLRNTSAFTTKLEFHHAYSCTNGNSIGLSNSLYLSDGVTDILLWEFTSASSCGGGDSSSLTKSINLSGNTTGNIIKIYEAGTLYSSPSLSPLSKTARHQLKFRTESSQTTGGGTCRMDWNLYNLNMTGVSLSMLNSNYSANLDYNYTTDSLNLSIENIQRAALTAEVFIPDSTAIRYYLSNNNGTNWEEVTNGVPHAFTSTGRNISARFTINSSRFNATPVVYNYKVDINPAQVSNLAVDVGAFGVNHFNTSGTLNGSTSPKIFNKESNRTNLYVDTNCANKTTCNVPITLSFSSPGIVQLSNFNLTLSVNPVSVQKHRFRFLEPLYSMELFFSNFTLGSLNLSDLRLDYLGSKNITFFAHQQDDSLVNDTNVMRVRYSHFNLSLPVNVSFWEVFPKNKDENNVSPFGQTNTSAIWNLSALVGAYDDPFDIYVKTNETLNSCLQIEFRNNTNFTQPSGIYLNTSSQLICTSVANNTGSCVSWNFVSLNNCSNFFLPYFDFQAICLNCTKTQNWSEHVFTITE